MAKIYKKPFKDWLYEEVGNEFGLTEVDSHFSLDELATIALPADNKHRKAIEELRILAFKYIDSWT
jgi:hypothetical protein